MRTSVTLEEGLEKRRNMAVGSSRPQARAISLWHIIMMVFTLLRGGLNVSKSVHLHLQPNLTAHLVTQTRTDSGRQRPCTVGPTPGRKNPPSCPLKWRHMRVLGRSGRWIAGTSSGCRTGPVFGRVICGDDCGWGKNWCGGFLLEPSLYLPPSTKPYAHLHNPMPAYTSNRHVPPARTHHFCCRDG